MKTEEMICELRRLEEAHKNDFVGTCETNWSLMCHDVANRLEELLAAQKLCEDAVSRKYLLDQSYSIKFQTIDESDEEAYREKVVCVEDIEDAPSVKPIPIARVMTLAELDALGDDDIIWLECLYAVDGTNKTTIKPAIYQPDNSSHDIDGYYCMVSSWGGSGFYHKDNYMGNWRCWTSRPDEKRRAETPWESVK